MCIQIARNSHDARSREKRRNAREKWMYIDSYICMKAGLCCNFKIEFLFIYFNKTGKNHIYSLE